MRFTNLTKYDSVMIRTAIRFVKPSDVSGFDIIIKGIERGYSGTAYCDGKGNFSTIPLVMIRVAKFFNFPYFLEYPKGTGYLSSGEKYQKYNIMEIFIYLIAHELRHLWQKQHKKGWRVWGSRSQYSERDADAYAIHKLREWRREYINQGEWVG